MAHFPTSDGRSPWRATVLTLFPEMFPGPLGVSLAGSALSAGLWSLASVQIRDFGLGRHRRSTTRLRAAEQGWCFARMCWARPSN